jgi:alkylated DNA repair protein (DNA oxidative demethylase)
MGPMNGELFPRERRQIAPGAVQLPDWLALARQREPLSVCQEPPIG